MDDLKARLLAAFGGELDERRRALEAAAEALDRGEGEPAIRALLRSAHGLKGAARAASLPLLEAACHGLEEALAPAAPAGSVPPAIRELLSAFLDALADAAARLVDGRPLEEGPLPEVIAGLSAPRARPAGPATPPVASAPAAQPTPAPGPVGVGAAPATVRVSAERLDALLADAADLLALRGAAAAADELGPPRESLRRLRAQLATARPALRAVAGLGAASREGRRAAEALGRLPAGLASLELDLDRAAAAIEARRRRLTGSLGALEEELLGLRMVPFADACVGLERAAADAARAASREVHLALEGAGVEVDRALVETLREALLHLVRNAVVHGIEPPTERLARGKPAAGAVRVAARVAGEELEVLVEDDGGGLDLGAIRAAARARGLPEPAGAEEAAELIHRPGFSSASGIDALAGRGIGLDAVRAAVEAVHGTMALAFTPGRGARARLRVPLTLAVVETLLVTVGGRALAFLAAQVRRLVRIEAGALKRAGGRELVLLPGGEPVGVSPLAAVLGLSAPAPARGSKPPAVVVEAGGATHAFVVDEVRGGGAAVLVPLGPRLRRVPHLLGAARLPDGGLALVLNGPRLLASATAAARGGLGEALAPAPERRRRRILLVDDSVTTRALERSILEGAGYDVRVAADGEEARVLLDEGGADLVLSDVDMPRLDGFGLTHAIRGSPRFRDLPVVLLTALESEEDRRRGLDAGANAYLVKGGFDQRRLLETIAALVA